MELVKHPKDCGKQYKECNRVFRITNYDTYEATKLYLNGDVFVDPLFNPIEPKTVYKVNKQRYLQAMSSSPLAVRESLKLAVHNPDRSPSITILV
jgi:hypothetical protein